MVIVPTVGAIPTTYNGTTFRSRHEAKWAVFFDELRIDWHFEPQGYELRDGTFYLPDFWLPRQQMFWEVKPTKTEGHDKAKLLAALTGRMVVVSSGYPDEEEAQIFSPVSVMDGFADIAQLTEDNPHIARIIAERFQQDMPIFGCAITMPKNARWFIADDDIHFGARDADDAQVCKARPFVERAIAASRNHRFWDPKDVEQTISEAPTTRLRNSVRVNAT